MVRWIRLCFVHGDNWVRLSLSKFTITIPIANHDHNWHAHLAPMPQKPEVVYAGLVGPLRGREKDGYTGNIREFRSPGELCEA